jgi:hypothetical protein
MERRLHAPEQVIRKPREADAIVAPGGTVEQARRKLALSGCDVQYLDLAPGEQPKTINTLGE